LFADHSARHIYILINNCADKCRQIELTGVDLKLNTRVSAEDLLSKDSTHSFDQVVLATGVLPRQVCFPGSDHPKVVTYVDVLRRNVSEIQQTLFSHDPLAFGCILYVSLS
jgi:NADPH-dependent glutamate synthase beta subunit-like oxidoreductase